MVMLTEKAQKLHTQTSRMNEKTAEMHTQANKRKVQEWS
jgi:hypothetical protein